MLRMLLKVVSVFVLLSSWPRSDYIPNSEVGQTRCVQEIRMVFNSNLPTRLQFRVAVQDRFAQKAIEVYRGFIQLFTDASQACQATQARKTPDDSRVPPRLNSQTSFKVQSSHCLHHIVLCTLESLVTAAEDVRFFSSCLAAALLEMLWLTISVRFRALLAAKWWFLCAWDIVRQRRYPLLPPMLIFLGWVYHPYIAHRWFYFFCN